MFQEDKLVAGDKVGVVVADQVRRTHRIRTKAQVRNGQTTGFLGVIDEIALRVIAGVFADNLGGVLIGADCAVRTESKEYAAHHVITFDGMARIVFKAE